MKAMPVGARLALRLSAGLLLVGQLFYVFVTQFHVGGDANDHHAIFAAYASDGLWMLVHIGQYAGIATMAAGLLAFWIALEVAAGRAIWTARFGGAAVVVTLALYGVLQAVDGVALKHSVEALQGAAEAERAARFASAEVMRWLEWGMRSYLNYTLGIALLLLAAAAARATSMTRPVAYLMAFSGLAYLAQGWLAGAEGFSAAQSIAIVVAWVLSLIWMTWLALVAWRAQRHGVKGSGEVQAGRTITV